MLNYLVTLLGTAVLLCLGADVFLTVFHPEGHGGPLTRRQARLAWALWRGLAPQGKSRDGWFAFGGPLLAVLTPTTWATLLIGGFALIYYPWMEQFLVSPGSLRNHWAEALYFSAFSAATLGTGDIVPNIVSLRLLSVLEALSGFALLSASLSYILAIYNENGRKTTVSSEIAVRSFPPPTTMSEERDEWLNHVARELLHIKQAHAQYPILHYFRPRDPSASLTLQIGVLVRLDSDRQASPPLEESVMSSSEVVSRALTSYLEAADRRFVSGSSDAGSADTNTERYRRLLDYVGYRPEDGELR
jgi:hypothetical protein